MLTFMAGATTMGVAAGVASSAEVARSSAMPAAILAITFAVAGTTTTTSAQSARSTWGIRMAGSG